MRTQSSSVEGSPIKWPTYDPPYDSPIEDIFAYNLDKYLPAGTDVARQVEVPTQCETYRLDFVCPCGARIIAFECDGQQFHEDEDRDQWRDSLIMATGRVNAIYRVSGRLIFHQIERALYLLISR